MTATATKPKKASKAGTMRRKPAAKTATPVKKPSKKKELIEGGGLFDYNAIREGDAERLKKYADKLAAAGGEAIKNFVAMGEQLYLARALCQQRQEENAESGKAYSFAAWCEDQGINRSTAYRYISAHETFHGTAVLKYATPNAIYLLCANSTSDAARKAAMKMADSGKPIDEKAAKALIAKHKPEAPPPRIAGPTLDELLTVAPPENAEPGEKAPVVIDAKTDDSCPSGGSHQWESDGNGKTFCQRCNAEYTKKEFGAKLPREERKAIQATIDKLGRQLRDAGILERVRPELAALNSVFQKL